MNASLRFAFTSKVERGAFYNTKEVRKESKGVCLSKGVISKKGVLSKKGCTWKKEKGEIKAKRIPKHVCKRRGYDNKFNTKTT